MENENPLRTAPLQCIAANVKVISIAWISAANRRTHKNVLLNHAAYFSIMQRCARIAFTHTQTYVEHTTHDTMQCMHAIY